MCVYIYICRKDPLVLKLYEFIKLIKFSLLEGKGKL